MARSKIIQSENRKKLIDASAKKTIQVKPPYFEPTDERLKQEMDEIMAIADMIRKQNYSSSAAVTRIKKRTFSDLVKARLYVVKKNKATKKAAKTVIY